MALITQYDSTVKVGIGAIVAPAAKNAAPKNHPYRIVLVHLTLNVM